MPNRKNGRTRPPTRRRQGRRYRNTFNLVKTSGIFRIHLADDNLPTNIPLIRFAGGLDVNRAYRLKWITIKALPVNYPAGTPGVIRVGQKGNKWAFNGPQNFLELGRIVPNITTASRATKFRPYGAGAKIFAEQPDSSEFQLEFLPSGCTYQPTAVVTLSLCYDAFWELERPELQDLGLQSLSISRRPRSRSRSTPRIDSAE